METHACWPTPWIHDHPSLFRHLQHPPPSIMVIYPFSPPILPSDYPHMYSSPPSTSSQTSSSSSRKRKRPETEYFDNNDHILKKQREESIITPWTPTSPPSTLSTLQRLTPPSDHEGPYTYRNSQSHNNKNDSNQFPAPSYVTYLRQENNKSHSSDALESIPDTNRYLRDLHLTARAHQSARKHEDEEMLEEEEEMVSERYSEMNKLLGSRKQRW
jgi:hypothetical protein